MVIVFYTWVDFHKMVDLKSRVSTDMFSHTSCENTINFILIHRLLLINFERHDFATNVENAGFLCENEINGERDITRFFAAKCS